VSLSRALTLVVAVVDERGQVLCRSSPFGEDEAGYQRLFELLGGSQQCLVALEATEHYWRNLFLTLVARGYFRTALLRLRIHRGLGVKPDAAETRK
jgi:transposase